MGYTPDFSSKARLYWDRLQDKVNDPVAQRRLVQIVVCIALLLDNMLYMVIVPIIPNFLRAMHEPVPDIEIDRDVAPTTTTTVSSIAMTSWISNGSVVYGKGWYNATYRFTTPKPTKLPPPPVSYGNEGGAIGLLFASKAIFQLCVNPFTGTLIDRIGYDIPMAIGLAIMFLSTTVFAFGKSYAVLFIARSMQGLGSAFADTSGLAMIADRFTEESERTKALGIALAFISFGCLFAPPFGGILYQFAGKTVPFLILASICLIDGILLLTVMKPVKLSRAMFFANPDRPKGTPIYRLLMDPYIAVCAGALAMSNVSLAFLEPTISLWMKDRMHADEWEIGFVWLPAFVPHIAGVYITVKLAKNYPHYQWLMAAIGLAMEGFFCFFIPFAQAYFVVIFPIMGICFGIALVDTALLPMLGYLVDVRHVSVYGSVYAIADISYSLAYAFGPMVAGSVVHAIGFLWLNVFIFLSNVGYAPVMILLRKTYKYSRFEDEEDVLVQDTGSLGHPDYKTYVQNGGITGKPHLIDSKGDDFANHLKIANEAPLYSREIDSYPPTNDIDYGYGNKEPPSFYQR
ncbi:hypothetical protein ACOMHN_010693 [Nucella lapillus]